MIARLLGRRRVKSTARYAHLDDRDVVAAVQLVGEAVEGCIANRKLNFPDTDVGTY